MIRLDLTIQQAQWLAQLLAQQSQPPAQTLLAQLQLASAQATSTQTCPVCHNAFTQLRRGRSGSYCSPACKQKAYRQRRNKWRRHSSTAVA